MQYGDAPYARQRHGLMLTSVVKCAVSLAIRYLQKNDWILIREEKKAKGKGRPTKLYTLSVHMDHIVEIIEKNILEESRNILQSLRRLKDMS